MAIGDIIRVIASLDFDTTGGTLPKIIHISGTTYAIAYQGYGNDGWLVTVPIADDGTIGAVIKSFEWDDVNGAHPWIIHISGNVYAIAYTGPGSNGSLKTLTIEPDGTIGAVIGTLVFDAGTGIIEPMIIHIWGNVYAIAYAGPDNDGWLKTVTINNDGTIGGVIDFLEFDPTHGTYPHILHIAGTVYAIAYCAGLFGPGNLITLPIANDGIIGGIINTFQFEAGNARTPFLFHVKTNVYAIAYQGPAYDGWLKTVTIADNGTIGAIIDTDTLEFDPDYTADPWVTPIADNIYLIAYGGPDGDGWMKTVTIEDNGTIGEIVSSFEFDPVDGMYPSTVYIKGNVYAIPYCGPGNDGWLKTIEIITPTLIINKAYALSREEL